MKKLFFQALLLLTISQAKALPKLGDLKNDGAGTLRHDINAFVGDSRQDLHPQHNKAPWTTIGRLSSPNGGLCSATLIGPNLILTAAHCALKDGQIMVGQYTFQLGYKRGSHLASAGVTYIWTGSKDRHDTDNDWAVLQLDRRLGDRFGWMGVQDMPNVSAVQDTRVLYLAGYGSDYHDMEVPFWQSHCRFRQTVPGVDYVTHDCSMSSGSSGSAMFVWDPHRQMHLIVAVNVAERRDSPKSLKGIYYSEQYANLAVPTRRFFSTLLQIMSR